MGTHHNSATPFHLHHTSSLSLPPFSAPPLHPHFPPSPFLHPINPTALHTISLFHFPALPTLPHTPSTPPSPLLPLYLTQHQSLFLSITRLSPHYYLPPHPR